MVVIVNFESALWRGLLPHLDTVPIDAIYHYIGLVIKSINYDECFKLGDLCGMAIATLVELVGLGGKFWI